MTIESQGRRCQSRAFRRSLDRLTSAEVEQAANLLEGFLNEVYPHRISMTAGEVDLPQNQFRTVPRGWLRASFHGPDDLVAVIAGLDDTYRFEAAYLVQEQLAERGWEESSEVYVDSLPPLLAATWRGQTRRVQAHLRAGEDPDQLDTDAIHTALILAASGGRAGLVKILLAAGASVDLAGSSGVTALMSAAAEADGATVGLLLRAGADVDHRDEDGDSALMRAAAGGNLPVLRLLLHRGSDVHAIGDGGFTALTYAAESGHGGAVEALLAAGAVDVHDEDGHGAAWHARHQGHDDLARSVEMHHRTWG